jgi:deazaflavin-dependent oxidoreductase (nitroreductase family)
VIAVTSELARHSRLSRIDYSDVYRGSSTDPRSAEAWIRRIFDNAPAAARWFLLVGWRVLGARLGPLHSANYVVGWRIDAAEHTWIRLSVEWRIGLSADLVLSVDGTAITLSTFVQHHNRFARYAWATLVPIHHVVTRYLVRRATDPLSGRRLVLRFQRWIVNPVVRRVARYLPGEAVLETVGRRSGVPRTTPVGGRLDGRTFWIVSEFGRSSNYVRNLAVNPTVRLQLGGRWHEGTATILEDDDVRVRLRQLPRLNSLMVRMVGTDLLTIRVDLEPPH